MEDFPGLLARDFGFRAQGKAAPMAAPKGSTTSGNLNFGIGSGNEGGRSSSFSSSARSKSNQAGASSFLDDDGFLRSSSATQKNHDFDVFGGSAKSGSQPKTGASLDYDSIFEGTKSSSGAKPSSAASLPVYDKPVYDDDIFDGVPGMKSTSNVNYDDVFTSMSSPPKRSNHYDDFLGNLGRNDPPLSKNLSGARSPKQNDHYDDLLGNLGGNDPPKSKASSGSRSEQTSKGVSNFDDLLPGFGSSSSPQRSRGTSDTSRPHQSTGPSNKSTSAMEDPFNIIEPGSVPSYDSSDILGDPLEQINKLNKPDKANFNSSSGAGVFGDDSFDDLASSVPSFSSSVKTKAEDKQPLKMDSNATPAHRTAVEEPFEEPFFKTTKSAPPKVEVSPRSEVNLDSADDIWITVSEVPLYTQPTNAPPPSRPPPPRPVNVSKIDSGSFSARNTKEKVNEFSSFQHFSPNYENHTAVPSSARNMGASSIDELEDFAMGGSRDHSDSRADVLSSEEEVDTSSAAASAAAMKEAMDRAEVKFKHAREVRERESAKSGRIREVAPEKDEKALRDAQERELREKQERLDREREQREREEKERERRRMEKERERARSVVERAQREAREKAAVEARQKAQKEARERAERAAVQRAQAEARERAAVEARERAERAAAEAKERSNAEARERAAAVARAETEVRLRAERASAERAAAEARERAAAREHQQKTENDLESFFSMGARPSSAPRPNRTTTSESPFDAQFQSRPAPEGARRTSSGTSSTIRKASSTTNMVDDLTSIFGGAPSAGEFQEIEGESEERRRARLERNQRTQERAAKALAEKNERDRQTQREQAERHRLGETLDIEIKRWSAGKEGNLRALLSTMQYVLWPECGWQAISLTDLITGAAVKKAYRKATLCIHPDKVQQKGATLQQKYISEKVFDLLKEAWTKFNSEELF